MSGSFWRLWGRVPSSPLPWRPLHSWACGPSSFPKPVSQHLTGALRVSSSPPSTFKGPWWHSGRPGTPGSNCPCPSTAALSQVPGGRCGRCQGGAALLCWPQNAHLPHTPSGCPVQTVCLPGQSALQPKVTGGRALPDSHLQSQRFGNVSVWMHFKEQLETKDSHVLLVTGSCNENLYL